MRNPGDSYRETGSEVVAMTWDDSEHGWVIKCSCGWQTFTPNNVAARWYTEIHGQGHWGGQLGASQ